MVKTFEEFTFKGFINRARSVKAKDPFLPEDEPYESMFVGTGRIFTMAHWATVTRTSVLKEFIRDRSFVVTPQWYNIKFGNGKKNKIIKIDHTYYNDGHNKIDNINEFKIYYHYDFKDGKVVNDVWSHPHLLVIDVSKEDSNSIVIEHLETIEYRKNMNIFKKLKINKNDNILASKATIGNTEFDASNDIFKVTGIDKGFYWGKQKGVSGYKIYAKDVIEILGPTIINRDIDPYGEEEWE